MKFFLLLIFTILYYETVKCKEEIEPENKELGLKAPFQRATTPASTPPTLPTKPTKTPRPSKPSKSPKPTRTTPMDQDTSTIALPSRKPSKKPGKRPGAAKPWQRQKRPGRNSWQQNEQGKQRKNGKQNKQDKNPLGSKDVPELMSGDNVGSDK